MKHYILQYVILLFTVSIISADLFAQNVGSASSININNIYLPFNNKGVIADVNIPPNGSGGQYAGGTFLFSSGFWLSGYTNDSLWANGVSSALLVEDYQAGTVGMDPNDPIASLYKLNINDIAFEQSWQDWIDAVDLGADFYDGDGDGIYNPVDINNNGLWDEDEDRPDLFLDETYWCVFNDGIPAGQRRWGVEPQGIEIKQTIFGKTPTGELGKVIFVRYRLTNTGLLADTLNDVFFGVWADPDIGDWIDDVGGCDTVRQGTYAYNNTPDGIYGDQVPAFMTDLLTGPHSYIPGITFIDINGNNIYDQGIDTPLDTAVTRGGLLGIRIFPGAKNLAMSSSTTYVNGDPLLHDPTTPIEASNFLQGYDLTGNLVDPCTFPYGWVQGGVPCNEVNPYFWFSGDPVTFYGWLFSFNTDVRQLLSAGPFKLVKDREVEVLVGYEIDRGNSPLEGISAVRIVSDFVQAEFENNFGYPIVSVDDNLYTLNNFNLHQNYPNPFNPATTIKYQIPEVNFVTIKVYDVLGIEITTLVNEEKPAGRYEVDFDATELTSGVYFYKLEAGSFVETKKMVLLK